MSLSDGCHSCRAACLMMMNSQKFTVKLVLVLGLIAALQFACNDNDNPSPATGAGANPAAVPSPSPSTWTRVSEFRNCPSASPCPAGQGFAVDQAGNYFIGSSETAAGT